MMRTHPEAIAHDAESPRREPPKSGFCDHEVFREHVNESVNDRTGKVLITIVCENRPWVTNPAEFPFV